VSTRQSTHKYQKVQIVVGAHYGRWTVLSDAGKNRHGARLVLAECKCGTKRVVQFVSLRHGNSRSCGCYREDVAGARYGRWTVLSNAGTNSHGKRLVLCRCSCGTERVVQYHSIKHGGSKSCGCWNQEQAVTTNTTHGSCGSRLYRVWEDMKSRCKYPTHQAYAHYGGRGITVCTEWHDFIPFQKWATENGYQQGLSIERLDNDAGYSPGNCCWATPQMQSRNRRTNHFIEAWGETRILNDWAADERCSITAAGIKCRLKKGMSPEAAISTPDRRTWKQK